MDWEETKTEMPKSDAQNELKSADVKHLVIFIQIELHYFKKNKHLLKISILTHTEVNRKLCWTSKLNFYKG